MMILLVVWGSFVIIAIMAAIGVALFEPNRGRRKDALQVLRTVLGAGTTLSLCATGLIKLHQAGLL
jgi:hypothetical protein